MTKDEVLIERVKLPPRRLEQWKPCVGFPDYEVSSHGRVRRCVAGQGKASSRGIKGLILKPWKRNGYDTVVLRRKGKNLKRYVHRLIGAAFLDLSDGDQIDHRQRDRSDNNVSRLRIATGAENSRNKPGLAGHSSRFKGVSYQHHKGKWYACIRIKGQKTKSLGRFDDEVDAAKAYDRAAVAAWGEFAFLNFVK
jgi:hypothetical protein